MKKTINQLSILFLLLTIARDSAYCQSDRCMSNVIRMESMNRNPFLRSNSELTEFKIQSWIEEHKSTRGSIAAVTIPVVVHVIWNDPIENVSNSQIYSQIDGLNEDFRLENPDSLDEEHPFWGYTIDTEIEFCLATVDPQGNPTTGITRTQTTMVSWGEEDLENIKSTAMGGKDNWDPARYLNLYVVNLNGSTLGFASFPDELLTNPEQDGVVIRYEVFGLTGTAGSGGFDANALGRTATHEVGHWLNLRHIWGDDFCGDDFVSDTAPAEEANFGCPDFPHNVFNGCDSDEYGEMFMNYMDYVDDNCMNMFTYGQALRMYASLENLRPGIINSNGCGISANLVESAYSNEIGVFPNPNNGRFMIDCSSFESGTVTITIHNILGELIKDYGKVSTSLVTINLDDDVPSGVYFVSVNFGIKSASTAKIFVSK